MPATKPLYIPLYLSLCQSFVTKKGNATKRMKLLASPKRMVAFVTNLAATTLTLHLKSWNQ